MKKNDTHPKYQKVLFVDSSTGHKYLIGSTLQLEETETYEGQEYPVCRVPTSSASHPFFTGSTRYVDEEGRIDKFKRRYAQAQKKNQGAGKAEGSKEAKKATAKKSKK